MSDYRYERVPIKYRTPEDSFRLPKAAVRALGRRPDGKFDPIQVGERVCEMFPTASIIEDGTLDILIPAPTVRTWGGGSIQAGQAALESLSKTLTETVWQPDGNHGRGK